VRIPIGVQWDRPLKRSAIADPRRGTRVVYFSAISRRPKPNDGHSIASDPATNTSGGVQVDAAAGPGDVAVALADGCTVGVPRGAMAPTGDDVTSEFRRGLKQLKGRAIHHKPDKP
jgi:hypothetical protein